MTANTITLVDERGVIGYDANDVQFGVFHIQIRDVVKTGMGCKIILDSGEEISIMKCYNRVSDMLRTARG